MLNLFGKRKINIHLKCMQFFTFLFLFLNSILIRFSCWFALLFIFLLLLLLMCVYVSHLLQTVKIFSQRNWFPNVTFFSATAPQLRPHWHLQISSAILQMLHAYLIFPQDTHAHTFCQWTHFNRRNCCVTRHMFSQHHFKLSAHNKQEYHFSSNISFTSSSVFGYTEFLFLFNFVLFFINFQKCAIAATCGDRVANTTEKWKKNVALPNFHFSFFKRESESESEKHARTHAERLS